MAAAETLAALLGAAAGGNCGSRAAHAVREATQAAITEAVEDDQIDGSSLSTLMEQHQTAELMQAYSDGFAAFNDPSLDEAVLTALLAETQRVGPSNRGLPDCALLGVPLVSALISVLCRRSMAIHALPHLFPRFQNELCLVSVHFAISGDTALAGDVLDAAQVFAHDAADTVKVHKELGSQCLTHAVNVCQLLRLGQGDTTRMERLIELVGSRASNITVHHWVQLYDHMCIELGTNCPRAVDGTVEIESVVTLLRRAAAVSLKLRQGIYNRSMEILALSSRPAVRELCLRLMVRVVGSQRALIVTKLSELSRSEPTIAIRNTCLALIRTCFDDYIDTYIKQTALSLANDVDCESTTSAPAPLEQALRGAAASLRITATDDASPKVRRNALVHAVAATLNMEEDQSGAIKLAASRCFDKAIEVRTEALAQLAHIMSSFPEVVAGLRPPIGTQCSMPWHDLVLQLLVHQHELLADAEATAKKVSTDDEGHDNCAEGEATDERLRTSEVSRQIGFVCETVLTQPALLGLKETATIDSAICSLRLNRQERYLLGKVLGRAILRLSSAQEHG